MTESPDLRVLVILNRLYEWSQNFITRELCELRRQDIDVTVAARQVLERPDLSDTERQLEQKFILIPDNPFLPKALWLHSQFFASSPRTYLKAWGHLLTFGHRQPLKLFRSLICLFRAASIAEQVRSAGIDLIHAHFMTAATETALYLSTMTGTPFGCTSHAMDIYRDNSGQQKKIDLASYLITETRANVEYFLANWQVDSRKLNQVYNSLPQPELERSHRKHDPVIFLAVGRLVGKKGFEYLIAACRKMLEKGLSFRCVIVGSGELLEGLKAQVDAGGLASNVEFRGYVAPNEMVSQYEDADILVMPSVIEENGDRDGLPTVCMEALYYGLPLVNSDVSGLPECIYEGENGFIVPARNAEALAEGMMKCMASDYEPMSRRSVQVAGELFDSAKNVARIKEIMLEAVQEA